MTDEKNGINDKMFLGLHHFTLETFGMRMPFHIVHEFEVWRWLTTLYVTHSFFTVMTNFVAQLVIGFIFEM